MQAFRISTLILTCIVWAFLGASVLSAQTIPKKNSNIYFLSPKGYEGSPLTDINRLSLNIQGDVPFGARIQPVISSYTWDVRAMDVDPDQDLLVFCGQREIFPILLDQAGLSFSRDIAAIPMSAEYDTPVSVSVVSKDRFYFLVTRRNPDQNNGIYVPDEVHLVKAELFDGAWTTREAKKLAGVEPVAGATVVAIKASRTTQDGKNMKCDRIFISNQSSSVWSYFWDEENISDTIPLELQGKKNEITFEAKHDLKAFQFTIGGTRIGFTNDKWFNSSRIAKPNKQGEIRISLPAVCKNDQTSQHIGTIQMWNFPLNGTAPGFDTLYMVRKGATDENLFHAPTDCSIFSVNSGRNGIVDSHAFMWSQGDCTLSQLPSRTFWR